MCAIFSSYKSIIRSGTLGITGKAESSFPLGISLLSPADGLFLKLSSLANREMGGNRFLKFVYFIIHKKPLVVDGNLLSLLYFKKMHQTDGMDQIEE